LIYFARDIVRIVRHGSADCSTRRGERPITAWLVGDPRLVPIGAAGLLFSTTSRRRSHLWIIATALVVFSAVNRAAEYFGKQTRTIEQFTWRDSLVSARSSVWR